MQNLSPAFFKAIEQVCDDWNANRCVYWEFSIDVKRKSIARTYKFVEDLFSGNPALVAKPGPFKVAAAFLISGMRFVEFEFHPLHELGKPLEPAEIRDWTNRLLFRSISALLSELKLGSTGQRLTKKWNTPTLHYRLDFLNFLRWTEFPILGPVTPPQEMKPSVDMFRLNRLIMAVTLIIESCYYLSGNTISCDVMNHYEIKFSDLDDVSKRDLYFDGKPPWAK
jgi:hypothetical protein